MYIYIYTKYFPVYIPINHPHDGVHIRGLRRFKLWLLGTSPRQGQGQGGALCFGRGHHRW